MKTLLQQIKPKYIECIKSSDYTYTSEKILAKLKSTSFYGDLTISELRDIWDMCGIDSVKVAAWDMRFGDNILIEEAEQLNDDIKLGITGPITMEELELMYEGTLLELQTWQYITELIEKSNKNG